MFVYPDTSTLSDAWNGSLAPATSVGRRFLTAFEQLARAHTVVLSLPHIMELFSARAVDQSAFSLCDWLDGLRARWLLTITDIERAELRLTIESPDATGWIDPLRDSWIQVMASSLNPEATAYLFSQPNPGSIRTWLSGINPDVRRSHWEDQRRTSVDMYKRQIEDIERSRDEGVSLQERRNRSSRKFEEQLAAEFVELGVLPEGSQAFVARALARPIRESSLRLWRLQKEAISLTAEQVAQDRPSATSRNTVRRFQGQIFDYYHYAGAVFSEVFFCDAAQKKILDPIRAQLNLLPCISRDHSGLEGLTRAVQSLL